MKIIDKIKDNIAEKFSAFCERRSYKLRRVILSDMYNNLCKFKYNNPVEKIYIEQIKTELRNIIDYYYRKIDEKKYWAQEYTIMMSMDESMGMLGEDEDFSHADSVNESAKSDKTKAA